MKNQRSTEIKVGLVTLSAVILFILGITLGRGCHDSLSSKTITMRFPGSGGIQPTAPVVVNGVKRGSVIDIKNDNGSVLISCSIDNTDDLKKDISAKITILEITGGKKIDINPGKSDEKWDPKSVIQGTTPADIGELITIVGELSGDIVSLFRRIDTIIVNANNLMNDQQFIGNIKQTVQNSQELTSNLNGMLTRNMDDLEITLRNLKIMSADLKDAISNNEPKVNRIIDNLDKTSSDISGLIKRTEKTIASADSMLAKLSNIADSVQYGKGTVSKLIYDRNFAAQIDSTLRDLKLFINQAKNKGLNTNIEFGHRK
jgi:phospholipid/cholesterol/gamma-HCH transport system substrate-binding protein